jgi:hypothetical protein
MSLLGMKSTTRLILGLSQYGHGYPDPEYLNNTIMELAAHGICEDDAS